MLQARTLPIQVLLLEQLPVQYLDSYAMPRANVLCEFDLHRVERA